MLCTLLSSCEEEIEYKYKNVGQFLVPDAAIETNKTPYCKVSLSKSVMDVADDVEEYMLPYLENAHVELYDGTTGYELKFDNDSKSYINSDIIVVAGKTYKLIASYDGMESVCSYVTVPDEPECSFSVEEEPAEYSPDGRKSYKHEFEFTIHDDPNTKDFYRIMVYHKATITSMEYTEDGWVPVTYHQLINMNYLIECQDPVFHWNQIGENSILEYEVGNKGCVFNDDMFNGQTKKLKFNVNTIFWADAEYLFELHRVTEDTYLYYRSLSYVLEYDNDYSLQPATLHCNVEKGAGLVVGGGVKSYSHVFENGRTSWDDDYIYY